ncbi:MAG: GtrA family protein, partial [Chloroflexi bacterium]|nr:GtrA family protein [Chloroflexota bacterium]
MRPVLTRSGSLGSRRAADLPERAVTLVRRATLGLPFLVVSLVTLYALRHILAQPMALATLIGAELGILATFLVDDRWFHRRARPGADLLRHHRVLAPGVATWFITANLLSALGVEYLLAAVLGQVAAVTREIVVSSETWARFAHAALELVGEPITAPPLPPTSELAADASEPVSAPRGPLQRQRLASHLAPALFLIAAGAYVLHLPLFFGYRLLGNSDRLNHYLSFILYHTHYLEHGQFAAWSDFIFDGFDTTALPMSFPTPLYALPALLHSDDVVSIFGVIAFLLLALTLLEAYAVIYMLCRDRLAAVAGATTYACATYALLKLVQSDQTYLSVLTAPIFFYLIHTTTQRNWPRRFIALTLLVAIECYFAFLQEFSYNLIFFFVYAAYLFLRRNRYPLFTFGCAFAAGVVLSLPRLLAEYANLGTSGRGRAEPVLQDVVGLRTLLRFFSRDIFGHSWRDQLALPDASRLNFHEGDLLHSSVFGALLLLLIILGGRWLIHRSPGPASGVRFYGIVFVPYILFVFAVMHVPAIYLLFDRLYLNVSFQHSRLSVSAMLPVAILTALFLAEARTRLDRRDTFIAIGVGAVLIGLSALSFPDMLDHLRARVPFAIPLYLNCSACPGRLNPTPILTWDLLRLVTLTMAFGVVVAAAFVLKSRGWRIVATV